MKHLQLIITLVSSMFSALATVVPDSSVSFGSGYPFYPQPGPGTNVFSITVKQALNGSSFDYTGIWFGKAELPSGTGSSLAPFSWAAGEGADYYLAAFGTAFTSQTISEGQLEPLYTTDHPYTIEVPYGDFYLGINTGVSSQVPLPSTTAANRDVFGWVHLQNTPAGLTMLGNAMAYDTSGIYIGTFQPVPEPTAASIVMLGLTVLRRFRR